jgi:5-methylthioribose kinase
VLAAHLAIARCPSDVVARVMAAAIERRLDAALVAGFAGVEIMRRLIGVAQLPLSYDIDRKRSLLRRSRQLVVEPHRGFE